MTWFERLTGFSEQSPQQVRDQMILDGETLTSRANRKSWRYGRLETPSLAELRARVEESGLRNGRLSLNEVVANVQDLHVMPSNAGALFQVASQFNLLEMAGPSYTPELGIGIYENDRTQGPACAIAAGAGTIYRNYFAPVNGQIGQTANNQIDCLADIGETLGNRDSRLWTMRNGYVRPSENGLADIARHLDGLNEEKTDQLRRQLRIGIQWNTQVTLSDANHTVTQIYGSALPVAYAPYPAEDWEKFARLILDASYEATLCTAALNAIQTGNSQVFLTLLGGGAFGNATVWIIDAIQRALTLYRTVDLDVAIVSYGSSDPDVQQLVREFN